MTKVAVLLSAYRGEEYIVEQLNSILNQEDVDLQIFIRDDGSGDGSLFLLRNYAAEHPKVHLFEEENVGVGNSFMNLLYMVPDSFDYYAFSDQDDIWKPRKLIEAVQFLEDKKALLYGSNQECVDQYGRSLGLRYAEDATIHLSPVSVVQENNIAGCTMVFSNAFWQLLSNPASRPSEELLRNRIHDVWLASVAAIHGGLVYDSRSFMKYRQHGNNVVGAFTGGLRDNLRGKAKKLKDPALKNGRSLLAKELLRCFPEIVKKYPLLVTFAQASSLEGKAKLLSCLGTIHKEGGESRGAIAGKILLNLF